MKEVTTTDPGMNISGSLNLHQIKKVKFTKKFQKIVLTSMIILFGYYPALVAAAPFCATGIGIPPQCYYYDTAACNKRANELGGTCSANKDELVLPPGNGTFCSVTSSRITQCIYRDRASCDSAAGKSGAVCVDNSPASSQPNIFREDPRLRY